MKAFHCQCGQSVFFDSSHCINCNSILGFDPVELEMRSLAQHGGPFFSDASGRQYRLCRNRIDYAVCNWLVPAGDDAQLCMACEFNRMIVNLAEPVNVRRWQRFETAKKRLFFTLLRLGVPLANGFDDPRDGLLFDFIEDQRSNPGQHPESFVNTGFHGGVITINALEADDSMRERVKAEMNETYRTLLGHLRHEAGHYYWPLLDADPDMRAQFSVTFGDPERDYQAALAAHYANGPSQGWRDHYISAYASAHPSEDWAETWGHYLHIYDALETAANSGAIDRSPEAVDIDTRISIWQRLSVALNELNRSSGLADAYPFVLNAAVAAKFRFVDEVIRRLRQRSPAAAGH
jgi:hypothetical protein